MCREAREGWTAGGRAPGGQQMCRGHLAPVSQNLRAGYEFLQFCAQFFLCLPSLRTTLFLQFVIGWAPSFLC